MKKLIVAALLLAAASAQAATYSDGTNRVIIPKGCKASSCMSVSVPGHTRTTSSRRRRPAPADDAVRAEGVRGREAAVHTQRPWPRRLELGLRVAAYAPARQI
jgi:hypothetical protein